MTDAVAPAPAGTASGLKVGLLLPSLSGGGAEFVAVQWAEHLARQGHRPTLLTTHQPDATHPDVPVVALRASSFPARVRALRSHVAEARYDVLMGLMPHWNLLVLLATRGLSGAPATVISGRNVEAPLRRIHGLSYKVELGLAHRLYRSADAYVAISHPVAAEAAGVYSLDPDRVWVVPNPATGKDPARAAAARAEARAQVGTGDGRSVTLTIPARLVPQKRPVLAVETAALLRERDGLDARVDFFGKGPLEAEVRAAAERLGVPVTFRGWVTSWFDEAEPDAVVLLTSAAEGFANVLVEAAAAGIPSVASSRALGSADAIVPHVTGEFAIGAEPADYADAVLAARGLAPVSQPAWLERFSPAESGRALEHVFRSITAARA
ncbi:glycosyltransferase [Microlunatus flavus]|uniref:Glycosyltransferase involved in cell wall bisynthesis n=1 Tax=Microlunatus flavus TaxID=1036181 RepID=A0A1H9H7Z6_9ACTN|nr:glycosyltransferase [Microlunatus flavus]SEQ58383.1 Glycosyltransferase involved in cell wall bisynthesis [Microlunatus flavus]